MRAPRIISSTTEAPPFGGDLPARLGALTPYTSASGARELPAVSAVPVLTPLRQRAEVAPLIMLAVLITSAATLFLALTAVLFQKQPTATNGGATEPKAAISVSSRAGVGSVHCISDVVTVTVTRTHVASDSVMVGSVDTPNGSVQLVLRPAGGKYVGDVHVDSGVLRTERRSRGVSVWPDQRIILRVNGLLDAHELHIVGRQTRLGSRGDGPCS